MTAELARSRGLDIEDSGYAAVLLDDGQEVAIDERYMNILWKHDKNSISYHWRHNIPGNELADILEAGLVELEGEPDE